VILKPDQSVTESEIIHFCRERLASYKAPRTVIITDEFPRNALGKIQKAILRDTLCGH
jgi:acyl-CoA synthetase (AMP-forming)/AMP-acid ligase II